MNQTGPVYVKRSGFLTALVYGVFGLLTTVVLCASGVGVYALHIADGRAGDLLNFGESFLAGWPEFQAALPPALTDAIQDRRAPDYLSQMDVSVRIESRDDDRYARAVVEVTNNGPETVTLMALNVSIEDDHHTPLSDFVTYAVTPLAIDDGDWRGPLLPGNTRRYGRTIRHSNADKLTAVVEVSELRVWQETAGRAQAIMDPS